MAVSFGTVQCTALGQERPILKKGYTFAKVVDILIKCLRVDGDYKAAVSKELVGVDLTQGYKVLKVVGAGNVGTTLLVKDIQADTAVLKIYHSKGAVT